MLDSTQVVEELFSSLVTRINALPERTMRREVMGEVLLQCSAETRAELLQHIVVSSAHSTRVLPLLLAFQEQPIANHRLSYREVRETYEVARERGYIEVLRFFLTVEPTREEEDTPEGHHQLAKVALGRRKTMARGHDINMLEKLLLDPEPSVIRNLLRNPRITEREVLRIATRRPNQDTVLTELSQHPRWFERYSVKSALCKNPYSPPMLVLGTMACLQKRDLKEIAHNRQLHIHVRKRAMELLIARQGNVPWEEDDAEPVHEGVEVSVQMPPVVEKTPLSRKSPSIQEPPAPHVSPEEPEA